MTREQLYENWRSRVEECGGVRPALRKYGGMMRRTSLQNLLRWGEHRGYSVPDGFAVGRETVQLDAAGNVERRWVKLREDDNEHLVEALQSAFASYDGAAPLVPGPAESDDELLTLYPVPDLHFGMQAWGAETGTDYDVAIAADLARSSIRSLVAKSDPSKRAVILVLGDFFHQNDQTNATPANKHRLDVDGRWEKVYEAGALLMTEIVDLVAQKHRDVDVVVLPGNHDEDAAKTLRVALGLFYSKNDRIRVYRQPGVFWYDRFGKCLFGATHGDKCKPERMALVLATDRPADWGETVHRHFFSGHIHHATARDIGPVRVESFTTPAAGDSYAHSHGYRSTRALSAITYHCERGEIGRHRVNITP